MRKHITDFVASGERGSFRAWLLKLARWRIQDQFRKRLPSASTADAPADATARTSTGTPQVSFIAFDPEGKRLAFGSVPHRQMELVGLLEMEFGRGIYPFLGFKAAARKVWFSPYVSAFSRPSRLRHGGGSSPGGQHPRTPRAINGAGAMRNQPQGTTRLY